MIPITYQLTWHVASRTPGVGGPIPPTVSMHIVLNPSTAPHAAAVMPHTHVPTAPASPASAQTLAVASVHELPSGLHY